MNAKEKNQGSLKELQAAIFDASHFKRYSHDCREDVVNILKELSFQSILDLDCGTGTLLETLLNEYPDIDASGLDYSLLRLEEAKEKIGHKVNLRLGNAQALPYSDKSFDVVICTTTFHRYFNPVSVLEEVHRVLKPKGRLIICDTYLDPTLRTLNTCFKSLNDVSGIRMYSQKQLWSLLNKAGFTGINWQKLNKHAYLAMAEASKIPLMN